MEDNEIRICPDCGYEGPKDDFLEYSLSEGTAGFVCPQCSYFGAPAEFVIKDIKDSEGTQVTDISTKEDYPKFKRGKRITNLVESTKPFIKRKSDGKTLTKEEVKEKWKEAREDGGWTIEEYPFDKYLADIDDTQEWEFLNESYNYIGTDIDEEPRDDKSHKEKVFIVYDKYGEIGEYHTKEEAQKVIDEWYIDPELYSSKKDADLRIEEDVIDVLNHKIVVHDDLS